MSSNHHRAQNIFHDGCDCQILAWFASGEMDDDDQFAVAKVVENGNLGRACGSAIEPVQLFATNVQDGLTITRRRLVSMSLSAVVALANVWAICFKRKLSLPGQ